MDSGGALAILSGGYADPTTIYSGGTEIVSGGGSDDGAVISGGTQLDYGTATNATIFTGSQVIESGGTASNTMVSGGSLEVMSGGTADAVGMDDHPHARPRRVLVRTRLGHQTQHTPGADGQHFSACKVHRFTPLPGP